MAGRTPAFQLARRLAAAIEAMIRSFLIVLVLLDKMSYKLDGVESRMEREGASPGHRPRRGGDRDRVPAAASKPAPEEIAGVTVDRG